MVRQRAQDVRGPQAERLHTIEGMSRLRAAGFDDTSVSNLTKAFADIKRLSPDATSSR